MSVSVVYSTGSCNRRQLGEPISQKVSLFECVEVALCAPVPRGYSCGYLVAKGGYYLYTVARGWVYHYL